MDREKNERTSDLIRRMGKEVVEVKIGRNLRESRVRVGGTDLPVGRIKIEVEPERHITQMEMLVYGDRIHAFVARGTFAVEEVTVVEGPTDESPVAEARTGEPRLGEPPIVFEPDINERNNR